MCQAASQSFLVIRIFYYSFFEVHLSIIFTLLSDVQFSGFFQYSNSPGQHHHGPILEHFSVPGRTWAHSHRSLAPGPSPWEGTGYVPPHPVG